MTPRWSIIEYTVINYNNVIQIIDAKFAAKT